MMEVQSGCTKLSERWVTLGLHHTAKLIPIPTYPISNTVTYGAIYPAACVSMAILTLVVFALSVVNFDVSFFFFVCTG
jgi:hypothetical protein